MCFLQTEKLQPTGWRLWYGYKEEILFEHSCDRCFYQPLCQGYHYVSVVSESYSRIKLFARVSVQQIRPCSPCKCFQISASQMSVYIYKLLGILRNLISNSVSLGWKLRFCICNKLPSVSCAHHHLPNQTLHSRVTKGYYSV